MRAGGRSLALGDVCWRQIASISPPCPQVDCNAYYFHLIKTYLAGPRREENNRAFVLPRSPVGRSPDGMCLPAPPLSAVWSLGMTLPF